MTAVGGGEFDIAQFFAFDEGADLRGAGGLLDTWATTAPPGHRPSAGAIVALRAALDGAIAANRVNRATAAHLTFAFDVVEATAQFESDDWNGVVLAYLAQVRLTDDEWAAAVRSSAGGELGALGAGGASLVPIDATRRLRIEDVPSALLIALHRAEGIGSLRELTTVVRRRAQLCIERATTGNAPYERWLLDLAALGVALEVRRFFPVSREAPHGPVASRPVADLTAFHPFAETLFAPDEIAAIRATDAELDRHEGDLASAVTLDLLGLDGLGRLAEAFTTPAPPDERAIRRAQLRSLRDRFRVPPVLADALEAELALPDLRPAAGDH